MTTGEQLSAYLAGELDAEEREAVEAALDRDPELHARLQRLRASQEALGSLPPVAPPEGFSERLHAALDEELERTRTVEAHDELADRRSRRSRAFRPLGVAAAAAAVIALFGVAGVWLMQGGAGDRAVEPGAAQMEAMDATGGRVPVVETDNDFDEQDLRRLAVNVEYSELVPRELSPLEATPLAEDLQRELEVRSAPLTVQDDAAEPEAGAPAERQDAPDDTAAQGMGEAEGFDAPAPTSDDAAVARCLPTVLEDARSALIPVYVELARFDGEPAVIYTLVAEDPDSGTYRRVEVWALARSDCQVLSFAQYDRE